MAYLIIEGKDAVEFADRILEGHGITDGCRKVNTRAIPEIETAFYNGAGQRITSSQAVTMDPQGFYVTQEIRVWRYPNHRWLSVKLSTAMRSEGWKSSELTPDQFIEKLQRRAYTNGLNVTLRY